MRGLTPCGRTRREFLWQCGGGFAGTALTYLLAEDGFFGNVARAAAPVASPLATKNPHYPAKATSCIFLFALACAFAASFRAPDASAAVVALAPLAAFLSASYPSCDFCGSSNTIGVDDATGAAETAPA